MWRIDNRDVLKWASSYTGPKFHAMLCDPPYHLTSGNVAVDWAAYDTPKGETNSSGRGHKSGFMGKQWDGGDIAFRPETWAALAQHLHPGAFIMAFAGTRGYHRMACAMEDAGLIIHPAIGWSFGSGFPKATRIDTQLDGLHGKRGKGFNAAGIGESNGGSELRSDHPDYVAYVSSNPLARAWAGHRYGLQALKPAFEFIAVAQVPYRGKPVDCITGTGAGALWIDGGRIGTGDNLNGGSYGNTEREIDKFFPGKTPGGAGIFMQPSGRWPANLILSHSPDCGETCAEDCAVRMLGEQSGERPSSHDQMASPGTGMFGIGGYNGIGYNDKGSASRFFFNADHTLERIEAADPLFYCAKAGRGERDAGLDWMPLTDNQKWNGGEGKRGVGDYYPDGTPRPITPSRNPHPTIKPLKLTQHLATLLRPPTEYAPRRLLVPFSGSGSEMTGALLAGWEEVQGVELESEYAAIAAARLEYWTKHAGELATVTEGEQAEEVTNWPKREAAPAAQPALF